MISAEWVTAIATAGTFIVIATSAIAALMQLRHMRSSNQINAYNECRETMDQPAFREALDFIFNELPSHFDDPDFLEKMRHGLPGRLGAVRMVGNLFESMGLFVHLGIMDKDIACELWASIALRSWAALSPMMPLVRRELDPGIWDYFEYMASISRDFIEHSPVARFPSNVKRMPVDESLLERLRQRTPDAG